MMDYPSQDIVEQLMRILDDFEINGQKITAIKEVRNLLALGLKEAKDFVEASEGGNRNLRELLRKANVEVLSDREVKSRKLRPEQSKLAVVEIFKKANVDLRLDYPENGVSIFVQKNEDEIARVMVFESNGQLVLQFAKKGEELQQKVLAENIMNDK